MPNVNHQMLYVSDITNLRPNQVGLLQCIRDFMASWVQMLAIRKPYVWWLRSNHCCHVQ